MTRFHRFRNSYLTVALALSSSLSMSINAAELQAVDRQTPAPARFSTIHPSPAGAVLIAPPALMPGKNAWLTVHDMYGKPLPSVTLLVNGESHDTDAEGRVSFSVPNTGAVSLTLSNEQTPFQPLRYSLCPSGLLARAGAADLVENISNTAPQKSIGPVLLFAPMVVEPSEIVPIIGKDFDPAIDADSLFVDGAKGETLAGSPVSLVAKTPARISVAPIQELYVAAKSGESSNTVETDVVRAELSYAREDAAPGKQLEARIAVYGTNLPALTKVTNNAPDVVQLVANDGKALGDQSTLIVPGGDNNFCPVSLKFDSKEPVACTVNVMPDLPELLGETLTGAAERNKSVLLALHQAKLIKAKRRLLGVEARLSEAKTQREQIPASSENPGADIEKLTAECRALAFRRQALCSMIAARTAIYRTFGATDDVIKQAMDDAAGGAYYLLEKDARAVAFVPRTTVVSTTAASMVPNFMPPPPVRRRLGEPRMILLPPLSSVMATAVMPLNAHLPLPGETTPVAPLPNTDKNTEPTKQTSPKVEPVISSTAKDGDHKPAPDNKQSVGKNTVSKGDKYTGSGSTKQKSVSTVSKKSNNSGQQVSKTTKKRKKRDLSPRSTTAHKRHRTRH